MSSKPEQVAILEPKNELRFKGPFSDITTSYLKITNPTDRRMCFKVKTTAPKRYCVRPNNGIVEPKATTQIAVMLQPFDINSGEEKNKHKFMVQTMFAPDGDFSQDNLWRDASPDQIMDSKLKCVFEQPPPAPSTGSAITNSMGDAPLAAAATQPASSPPVSHAGENRMPQYSSASSGVSSASRPSDQQANSEITRLLGENKRLRDELVLLRDENMQLKEEKLRQRHLPPRQEPITSPRPPVPSATSLSNENTSVASIILQPQCLAILLVALFLGYIFGKII